MPEPQMQGQKPFSRRALLARLAMRSAEESTAAVLRCIVIDEDEAARAGLYGPARPGVAGKAA